MVTILFLFFMFWIFGCEACGILTPQTEIEPMPPALKGEVLTVGPSGKSHPPFWNSFLCCLPSTIPFWFTDGLSGWSHVFTFTKYLLKNFFVHLALSPQRLVKFSLLWHWLPFENCKCSWGFSAHPHMEFYTQLHFTHPRQHLHQDIRCPAPSRVWGFLLCPSGLRATSPWSEAFPLSMHSIPPSPPKAWDIYR